MEQFPVYTMGGDVRDEDVNIAQMRQARQSLHKIWHHVYDEMKKLLPAGMPMTGLGPVWDSTDELWYFVFIARMRAFDFGVDSRGRVQLSLPNETMWLEEREDQTFGEQVVNYVIPLILTGGPSEER